MLSMVLAAVMVVSLMVVFLTTAAFADGANSVDAAAKINPNTSYSDNISDQYDKDYYKFTLSSAGLVDITLKHKDLVDANEYWTARLIPLPRKSASIALAERVQVQRAIQ